MKVILFFVLLLTCGFAKASEGEIWVNVMLASYHSDRQAGYNETNPGVGIEYNFHDSNFKAVAEVYRNSFKNTSVMLGGAWTPLHIDNVNVGVLAGGVSGYPQYQEKFGPIVAALIEYKGEKYGLNAIVIPPNPADPKTTWVTTLQFKMKL